MALSNDHEARIRRLETIIADLQRRIVALETRLARIYQTLQTLIP